VGAPLECGQGDGLVQRGRRRDDHDLGPRPVEHLLPAREGLGHAVAAGDLRCGRLVALAQAARVYWQNWLPEEIFRRDADASGLNSLLNYGYAVVRAAVARALVAAGLLPSLGLHHSNRSNAFCLADDLLEPLRPLVDDRARELYRQGCEQLDAEGKAGLLKLLAEDVRLGEETGPLIEKYLKGKKGTSGKERLQVLNLIQDITASDFGGYQAVLALHAEGSMEAEKLQLYREYDWRNALAFARKMARVEKER